MGTNLSKLQKEAQAWIRFIEPTIRQSKEVVVLGLGSGEHIRELQRTRPNLVLIVVEARQDLIAEFSISASNAIRFVTLLQDVETLQNYLKQAITPIPILCYRPCWYPNKIYFFWAYSTLVEADAIRTWNATKSDFILESLFV